MTRSSKGLIAAAIPIGAAGFLLDTPWSLVAAGVDLLLVIAALIAGTIARRQTLYAPADVGPSAVEHVDRMEVRRPKGWPDDDPIVRAIRELTQTFGPPEHTAEPEEPAPVQPEPRRRPGRRFLRRQAGARESFAPTARVRRAPRQVRAFAAAGEVEGTGEQKLEPAPEVVAVRSRVDALLAFSMRADRENRRAAVWWFVAAVAVSIPVGVLVNVLTG